ncbi:hypothetical protein BGZ50_009688, partial [Haplosporangium sp. Z 11]
NLWERFIRFIFFNCIPDWLNQRFYAKLSAYRPQIGFLPWAVNRGTARVLSQKPCKRYEEEQAKMVATL